MEKKRKYIFETEKDIEILRAINKFIGVTSESQRLDLGLTKEQSDLCSEFYEMLVDE